jgi:exonuclease VII large subunit
VKKWHVVRVAVTRPEEVLRALRQATGAQAVVITRGGSDGVQLLDNEELIGAVMGSPVPVAVALGHASDDPVLGRVADARFPTPTAFGSWLRNCLEEKRNRAREVAEAEVVSRSQELLDRLARLERMQAALASWRAAAVALGVLLAGTVGWLLLRP